MRQRVSLPLLLLGFCILAGGGCSPEVATRGHMVDQDRLDAVQEGTTRKDDVLSLLGTPSSTGTFDRETWYYIGQVTEKNPFNRPEAVERKVVVIKFDESGSVREKRVLALEDGQDVALSDRVTPTAGKEMSVIEQFVGNIGRFGGTKKSTGPGAPVGR